MKTSPRRLAIPALVLLSLGAIEGCGGDESRPSVVVYASLDREFSEPLLNAYAAKTGVAVDAKYDVESTKTVGLTNLLFAEAKAPRCDLFWNNEILNTLRLKKRGLLANWSPPNAESYPTVFKDKDGTWYGFAARARVLIVNTSLVPEADRPSSVNDLLDPRWKGKIGLAKPSFGTTATHAVCLFQILGEEKAKRFFTGLKANDVRILSGNKQVATAVSSGELAFGLTDTDDAMGELETGQPVAIIYPDRKSEQMGTLYIPNTLAILKGARHAEAAKALGNALLAPETESILASGPSAQVPLNPRSKVPSRVETPATVKAMAVDFDKAVDLWDGVAAFLKAEFGG